MLFLNARGNAAEPWLQSRGDCLPKRLEHTCQAPEAAEAKSQQAPMAPTPPAARR